GFKRVTASFSAKKFCDRRRYVYLLPVFALDPNSHRDRESVLASLGSSNELVKCLECSERGRKVGVLSGVSSNTLSALSDIDSGVVKEDSVTSLDNGVVVECKSVETITTTEVEVQSDVSSSVFSYGDKEKERFNKILKQYEGTHNFHNFTTRTKAADPSAKRYIISFNANTTVTVDGIEFVKCEVVGQSFMLHQIRKMIGVAVAIMRNCAPESLMESALQQEYGRLGTNKGSWDVRINVPTAPEVGLYLDECFFSSYNQKWRDTHEEVSMKDYAQEAEEFKLKYIYSHIASTEHKEGAVAVWLHSLNYRNYPDLCPEGNGGGNEVPRAESEETNGCKGPHNQNSNPYNEADPLLKLVAAGKVGVQPIHNYGKPRILEIDLEHLATTMKNRLNIIIPFIQRLRDCYHGESETAVTDTIISDVNMMVDTAISVTYNRLRYVLQRYDPTVFVARMNPRSPLSNKYKFPAFISFVLGNIGPLRIMDGLRDMLVVYATSASRSQTYGREQHFDFKYGQYSRIVDNLAEIGVPLAPIDVKVGYRDGSFFSTIIPDHKNGSWDFIATFHPSHYKHQALEDLMSAWLTMNDDPTLRAFQDCSLRIECCTDPDVVNAIMASRPEGV
ncbi:pseudouridine synthase, catalytic domain-containing protein, partial [Tanacetum coccineum]